MHMMRTPCAYFIILLKTQKRKVLTTKYLCKKCNYNLKSITGKCPFLPFKQICVSDFGVLSLFTKEKSNVLWIHMQTNWIPPYVATHTTHRHQLGQSIGQLLVHCAFGSITRS